MPRPRKSRNVCHFPRSLSFVPAEHGQEKEPVILTVDEYETIRLIDQEGFSQEECGERMGIARTTVQQIYATARRKLARMLVEGSPLQIAGGDYRLCDGNQNCGQNLCFKQYYSRQYEKTDHCRRVAVSCRAGEIPGDFEDTLQFRLYDIHKGEILASKLVDIKSADLNGLACILTALRTDILICGQVSSLTKLALDAAGVQLYDGISGDPDMAAVGILSRI